MGADTGDRYLSTVLLRLGARKVKKGKGCNMFYALNYDQLEGIAPSGAGIGEDHPDLKGGEGGFSKQWESLDNSIRKKEHTGHETEDGLVTGGAEGAAADLDNPRGGVPLSESETGDKPLKIPF